MSERARREHLGAVPRVRRVAPDGPPVASPVSPARGGLTRLSARLVSLGIRLIRSRPACPQDNGGHERMRRDLSELQLTPAKSRRAQQPECDRWVVDFNHVRPHDVLGGKTPAEVYRPAERRPTRVAHSPGHEERLPLHRRRQDTFRPRACPAVRRASLRARSALSLLLRGRPRRRRDRVARRRAVHPNQEPEATTAVSA